MSMTEAEWEQWQALLGRTADCPALEDLLKTQATGEARLGHEVACPNCQAELAFFAAFDRSPTAEECKAVQSVTSRLAAIDWERAGEQGLPAKTDSWWKRWVRPNVLAPAMVAVACSLALVTAIQLNHKGQVSSEIRIPESETVRSQEVETVSPAGRLASVPTELRWKEVPRASAYRVQIMEVDKTVLWQGEARAGSLPLPPDVVRRIVPGKRLLWEVTALSAGGTQVATSGAQSFTLNLQ
jgi:hypothetical protein